MRRIQGWLGGSLSRASCGEEGEARQRSLEKPEGRHGAESPRGRLGVKRMCRARRARPGYRPDPTCSYGEPLCRSGTPLALKHRRTDLAWSLVTLPRLKRAGGRSGTGLVPRNGG